MNFLIALISVLIIFYLLFSYYKKQKKYILSKKLSTIYDSLELNYIENNKYLNNNEIRFIKIFKQIAVNPELLDIHLLLISKFESNRLKLKNNQEWFEEMYNKQNDEFKNLEKEFNNIAGKLIKLSLFNSSFIFFILKIFISYLFVKGQFNIINFYKKLIKDLNFIRKNENILINQQINLA